MSRAFEISIALLVTAITSCPTIGADYRGMTTGWPTYANGYAPANYPANYAAGPAYYVARPVAPAYYAARPVPARYVPVTAAYANPAYFAAYGRAAAYQAPTAYYAPVTTNYAPANSYAVTPAGLGSAGSEAAAYYGQPAAVNYVPPRYTYRATYAAVPVYAYRPVTVYNPVVGQPVTCLQPATTSTCQTQRSRSCVSWLNPFTWFNRSSCGSSGCGAPPACAPAVAQTSYCGTANIPASGCAQPYYPAVPTTIIPAMPANTLPTYTSPGAPYIPPATPRVPSPPTRIPADTRPSLGPPPSGFSTPIPNTTFPSTTIPGATTPLGPAPLPGGFNPSGGSSINPGGDFPAGRNYPPATDPYQGSTPPPNATGPSASVFGSGYRGNSSRGSIEPQRMAPSDGVIRAPDLAPALPPSVETVPDLDAQQAPRPLNHAPQLIEPRDKTALRDSRWAVVPATWPTKESTQLAGRAAPMPAKADVLPSQPARPQYDDSGWKSAAGL